MASRLDRIVVRTADPAAGRAGWELVAREFPTVRVERDPEGASGRPADVTVDQWEAGSLDFGAFDRRLERVVAERRPLVVAGSPTLPAAAPGVTLAVLTRAQRLVRRHNRASTSDFFDGLLARHQDLYDLCLPRVRAAYDRALDVWQWALRLAPEASLALQLAALFHDLAGVRSEGRLLPAGAEDGEREPARSRTGVRSRRQARESAALATGVLAAAGVHAAVVERAGRLIAARDEPAGAREEELAPFVDAVALSFFSLDGPGLLDAGVPAANRQAIALRLARLSPAGRSRLAQLGLRPAVLRLLDELQRRILPPTSGGPPTLPGAAAPRPVRRPLIPR